MRVHSMPHHEVLVNWNSRRSKLDKLSVYISLWLMFKKFKILQKKIFFDNIPNEKKKKNKLMLFGSFFIQEIKK